MDSAAAAAAVGLGSDPTEEEMVRVIERLVRKCNKQEAKLIVTMHASTDAARREIKQGIAVPLASHLEMGVMWCNRSDSLVMMHRQVQNEELADRMEMHVCKIKSVRSGGKPTDADKPILMYYQESFGGFSWQPKPIALDF